MAEVFIYWMTRSRTVIPRAYPSHEYGSRLCTAVAWSYLPSGPWRKMSDCPIPEDPADPTWRLFSGRFENVPLEEIPH